MTLMPAIYSNRAATSCRSIVRHFTSAREQMRSRRVRSTSRRLPAEKHRTGDFRVLWRPGRRSVEREFETLAVRNQVFLQVTWAYSELLRAEGRRAAQMQARDEARVIAKLTRDYARPARAARPMPIERQLSWPAARPIFRPPKAEVLTASASALPDLESRSRRFACIRPTPIVVPHPLVPDPISGIRTHRHGPLNRPELAAQRAAIQAALMNLDGAKILPFSPTTIVGFSAGGFGGGSNLVRPIFGGFSGREDLDAIMYWTIQNLGVGNIALIRMADAQLRVTQFQQVEILNRVRADIAEAYAQDARPLRSNRYL